VEVSGALFLEPSLFWPPEDVSLVNFSGSWGGFIYHICFRPNQLCSAKAHVWLGDRRGVGRGETIVPLCKFEKPVDIKCTKTVPVHGSA
jgi:hypothetical protein